MNTLTNDLVALTTQAAALGGVCWLLLGQLFAWTDRQPTPLGTQGKLVVSITAPFVVAFAAYLALAGLGAVEWSWHAAGVVADTAVLAVIGAKGWHATTTRVQDHLRDFLSIVIANTAFLGPAQVQGVVAGGNVTQAPAPPPEGLPHA